MLPLPQPRLVVMAWRGQEGAAALALCYSQRQQQQQQQQQWVLLGS
jgi:hypothetical protein